MHKGVLDQESIKMEGWDKMFDYQSIIDAANANSHFRPNENYTYIKNLHQLEDGCKEGFFVPRESAQEIKRLLRKELKSVITKIRALAKYRKESEQLNAFLPLVAQSESAGEFYDVILKVKEVVGKYSS